MGGSAGLVLTRFRFAEVKVKLPPGAERRGGTGGVAAWLGLPCREVVTGVATGGAAALLAVEVSLQWARLDLAALVAPRVLQSPTVGCLDLPGDGLERLSLGHQTDPQPHVVETLQCSAVQCNVIIRTAAPATVQLQIIGWQTLLFPHDRADQQCTDPIIPLTGLAVSHFGGFNI